MIGVYFQGRLGNQLFQYAFGLSAAKKLRTSFFMDERYDRMLIDEYFELPSYSRFQTKYARIAFGKDKRVIEVPNSNSFSENSKAVQSDNVFYKGYFQSEGYFNSIKPQLLSEFKIKKEHRIDARKLLGINNDKPILAVHVRRTDYLVFGDESMGGKDLSLPLNYYTDCIAALKDVGKYNVVFVSDDKEFVSKNFSHLNPIVSSSTDPIVDFQVLLSADVLVLANSSFSWWAAYLNQQCTTVFAPQYWLGFRIKKDYPLDIISSSWQKMEVRI